MKQEATVHPSFLALDRFALGVADDTALRDHVTACPQCQRHVSGVVGPPPHARRVVVRQVPPTPRWSLRGGPLWASGALVAAAAALFLVWIPWAAPATEQPAFTTRRGEASVGIHVKRAGQVWLWDGQRPIEPGDRLRLSVAREGFTHIAVFTRTGPDAEWKRLYSAPLSQDAQAPLPTAWQVDQSPGPERLRVVLAHAPVDAELSVQRGASRAEGDPWIRDFEIPKRTGVSKSSKGDTP